MAHYNTSQLAMDEIYSWIMNSKKYNNEFKNGSL